LEIVLCGLWSLLAELKFGNGKMLESTRNALENEPSRLKNDDSLRQHVTSTLIFNFLLGNADSALSQKGSEFLQLNRVAMNVAIENHKTSHKSKISMGLSPVMRY
jgi:hypothetical protein